MIGKIAIPLLVLLALTAAAIWGATAWLEGQANKSGFTKEQALRRIVVGNDILEIPANYIRRPEQRDAVTAETLDLAMLWPAGTGYSADNADRFLEDSATSDLIFMTVARREMELDMTQRLDSVYQALFVGEPHEAGSDLLIRQIQRGSGYDDEVIVVSQDKSWVARCQIELPGKAATCLRDIHAGQTLVVRYRFANHLLSNWRDIEALVRARLTTFLKP
ncbi:MAG: hypothetical protein OXR62_13050 [Ahrensia sp.]|nr:hypothetical protein [Ahrensia sp.]